MVDQKNIISIDSLQFKPYIKHIDLNKSIINIANLINLDYKDKDPIIIGILNGSFMFMSDLCKNINIKCNISFIKVASYNGLQSTDNIKQSIGLDIDIKNKDIIIVEDIVDTGKTIKYILNNLKKENPLSINIATLFFKPESYKSDIIYKPKYIGFNIENEFIIGYGLDYNGYYRNLNDIYIKI